MFTRAAIPLVLAVAGCVSPTTDARDVTPIHPTVAGDASQATRVATVLGAVNKPGTIDIREGTRMTISMAIASAGSFTKFAAAGGVQVLRRTPTGNIRTLAVDLSLIGPSESDIELEPGDVVYVPERILLR